MTSPATTVPGLRPDAVAMAAEIARRHGATVAAVLFYGSGLRETDPQAILDLYVLVDDLKAFHGRWGVAFAGRLLPPNVLFLPANAPTNAGFKVAVMTLAQFAARMRPDAYDTTLWARFCQPSAAVYVRDETAAQRVRGAMEDAARTALYWARALGPKDGDACACWTALFRATYGAELRVEGGGRAQTIVDFAPLWYEGLFRQYGVTHPIAEADRRRACRRWSRRQRIGKLLNLIRLAKALFTFVGGVDYIVWKLQRHSGQSIVLTDWQKRHPLLAAPKVLLSLFRRGILR